MPTMADIRRIRNEKMLQAFGITPAMAAEARARRARRRAAPGATVAPAAVPIAARALRKAVLGWLRENPAHDDYVEDVPAFHVTGWNHDGRLLAVSRPWPLDTNGPNADRLARALVSLGFRVSQDFNPRSRLRGPIYVHAA